MIRRRLLIRDDEEDLLVGNWRVGASRWVAGMERNGGGTSQVDFLFKDQIDDTG